MPHALLNCWLLLMGSFNCFCTSAFADPAHALAKTNLKPYSYKSAVVPGHPDWTFVDLVPDLKLSELRVIEGQGGHELSKLLPTGAFWAINGGYFDDRYRPTGLVISQGRTLRVVNGKSLGGILAIKGASIFLGEKSLAPGSPDFAVQNSPVLIDDSGRIAIQKENGRRASRTVACLAKARAGDVLHFVLFFAVPGSGPTLLETAKILSDASAGLGFRCERALNLDGGPSSGVVFPAESAEKSVPPLLPIAYSVALFAK